MRYPVIILICLGCLIGLYAATRRPASYPPPIPSKPPQVAATAPLPSAITVRPRANGPGLEATIVDEHSRSVTARATTVLQRSRSLRDPSGERVIPLAQRFDDLSTFTTGVAVARKALAQTDHASPLYSELAHQVTTLHDALARTQLALVQEWSSDALAHLQLSAAETKQFAAIIDQQAGAIVNAAKLATAPSKQIRTLLGDERYAAYENRRRAFFPAGVHGEEVLP